jgi:DNA-binding transcriptional MerR regulator
MAEENLITATEAALLSGISSDTLARFAETGHLHVHTRDDGSACYERKELQALFGIAATVAQETSSPPIPQTVAVETSIDEEIPAAEFIDWIEPAEQHPITILAQADTPTGQLARPQAPPPSTPTPSAEHLLDFERKIFAGEKELFKLQKVVEMQEQLLKMKDAQIKDLQIQLSETRGEQRNERQWLQSRIEKMEQSSEAAQLILLAKTDAVMKILAEQRKSPLRAAMEWVGLAKPEAPLELVSGRRTVNVESSTEMKE